MRSCILPCVGIAGGHWYISQLRRRRQSKILRLFVANATLPASLGGFDTIVHWVLGNSAAAPQESLERLKLSAGARRGTVVLIHAATAPGAAAEHLSHFNDISPRRRRHRRHSKILRRYATCLLRWNRRAVLVMHHATTPALQKQNLDTSRYHAANTNVVLQFRRKWQRGEAGRNFNPFCCYAVRGGNAGSWHCAAGSGAAGEFEAFCCCAAGNPGAMPF
jgi:hypothetical protein